MKTEDCVFGFAEEYFRVLEVQGCQQKANEQSLQEWSHRVF